ncbi:MAG: HAMP domain-containing sensor histidine kinase [Eubacterium ramulus]|jgi:two-component system sensor histidine kinase VanS|uniref:histidine kinase n=1 Tax=Eubacterium ramulus TaxID=39490 RepID=A0A2V1JQ12_EUBRA|nr:HAMP domain-containing sensor histidine kinase [Eubacterium ramulus]PWE85423.1 histidine kinase [Eubacterium ramulus]
MKKHSLTRQITSIVSILVAGAILLCWVLNTTLLPRYYMHNKKHVLMENYETISNASEQDKLESDEFTVTFDNLCSNGNIMTLILQPDGKVLRSSVNDLDALRGELWNVLLHTDDMEVLYSNDQYQLLRKNDTRLDSEYLVLVGVLENGDMILMRTAVESIRESAAISNRFLLFVGAAAIVSSLLVAFFTTRHITKPLQQLTDISKRMVDLDFNAKYESNRSNSYEVEELGNHINRLSENLERTISELKTANVELQDDIEKKIQIDEMRKEFLSNVSHELKTPLALIQGYAEGLQECINDDAESREFYCDVIIDEADKMNRMVKKLLTLNQLEFGNDQVVMERFDMTELVRGVANSTKILMEQKGIRLELDNLEEAWVWGDEFKVEEVITNYMSNAINHADGGKVIRVFYTRFEDKLRVSVFNTGQPIPEDDIDKIWVKFYKVDKARTREYGGSGIGLSIVKAIMDSFHQQCGVINHEDGVEFWMELSTK